MEKSKGNMLNCPFGHELNEYWSRRFELFSKFDEGIQLDREGLYSVKPEKEAVDIGTNLKGLVVLDAFAGVGGSAIGLARSGKEVISVDNNSLRLKMAQNNARIYKVDSQIRFIHGDVFDVLREEAFDSVYLDPPWKGPDYIGNEWFTLNDFAPNGNDLLNAAFEKVSHVAITLPTNFDFRELAHIRRDFFIRWAIYDGNLEKLTPKYWFSTIYFE